METNIVVQAFAFSDLMFKATYLPVLIYIWAMLVEENKDSSPAGELVDSFSSFLVSAAAAFMIILLVQIAFLFCVTTYDVFTHIF